MPRKKVIGKRKNDVEIKPDTDVKKSKDNEEDASTSVKEEIKEKVVVFTGSIPLDEECTLDPKQYHVHTEQDLVFNAMLNQTNIGSNNNKYYVIQLLKNNKTSEFFIWLRWGRVGKVAGKTLEAVGLEQGKRIFQKKFRDKTGNYFHAFNLPFVKKKGKYDLLEMDYGEDKKTDTEKKDTKNKVKAESVLHKSLQDVMTLIFDITEWEESVKEMKFDIKKSPLGKLTKKQITAGYEALKAVETCITQNKVDKQELIEACSQFYTRIPHDFGMKAPPLIETTDQLKEKLELLEALNEIQVAISIVEDENEDDDTNPIDLNYKSLNCDLTPLDRSDDQFKIVKKYVSNTHGITHTSYTLSVEDVFTVNREVDSARFKSKMGNRTLLWHGSRLTNWCGILKQGLRIAPPEAPVTGYMFGKGVYFADMVSKSANYCWTSQRQPIGFLLLCEVALGNCNELTSGDYHADKLPKGKHSTKGIGGTEPNPKQAVTLADGTTVPLGKPKTCTKPGYLWYNEFIVYDVAQIKPRFLVKLKFNYKTGF
ncbi:poly [ADP-ribose] polymerase 2-like [Ciona intestinalis]